MRAIALISLLALMCVVAFSRPHMHGVDARGDNTSSSCAACQLGSHPGELPSQAQVAVANVVEVALEPLHDAAPRAERCLERAPKQGPPA